MPMSQHSAVHGATGKQSAGWGAEALKNRLGLASRGAYILVASDGCKVSALEYLSSNILSQPEMTED